MWTKRTGLTVLFLSVLAWVAAGGAQEEKETPSQKTKEAVEKLMNAPAKAAKGLETLKEVGKAKFPELGGAKVQQPKVGVDPLVLPERAEKPETPLYSSVGKRDPFQPFSLKAKPNQRLKGSLSPLELYEIGQLKVVGIIWDIKEPRAMVEDSAGLGYIVKVGTPIGPNAGKVKVIKPSEIVVEEHYVDFYGVKKDQQISMKLSAE